MQRSFILSVCAVVAIHAGNAAADSPHLKGTYGFKHHDDHGPSDGGVPAVGEFKRKQRLVHLHGGGRHIYK
jgi:hypothetical protein